MLWFGMMVLLLANRVPGQGSGDYLVSVWTRDDKLPSSSVTAIAQTLDGYLWIGTYNGLARFDGVRFATFDPNNTPALQRARVRRLLPDGSGRMWINTYDGSLTLFDKGKFTLEWQGDGSSDSTVVLVSSRAKEPSFLLHTGDLIRRRAGESGTNAWTRVPRPGPFSGALCVEADDGTLWYRTRDQKLFRLVGNEFEPVSTNSGLAGTTIFNLTSDPAGRIWVGTDRELARWDGSRFEAMTPTNGEPVLNVTYFRVATNDEVWVVANERVRKARGRQWMAEAEACRGVFTTYRDRLGIHPDESGGAWLYDYGKGLFHVRSDGRTRQLTLEENFPGERVDCFFEDREGNFWAGVDRGGLVRIREKRFAVMTPEDSAMGRATVTVAEDAGGAIWVGTFGGGLHRWLDDSWQNFSLPGAGRGFIFSVCPDEKKGLWVSAGEEDLYQERDGRLIAATPAVHGVKALLAARDGRLWVGTKSGLGVLTNGRYRLYQPEDGVQRVDVRALAEGPDGAIWAGAGDGTLYRVRTNRVESFRAKDAFASQPIWSLLAEADGTVWVGTFRGGLMRFRGGQFLRCSTRDGLPDDVICQILDDGEGALWVGSQQGIFRFLKADVESFAHGAQPLINCTAYGRYDGLPSLECSGSYQPSACRTSDGRLLFATLKGVVSVQPEALAMNRLPPPVVIEEALVDGHLKAFLETEAGRSGRRLALLEVPPGKRQVEVRYTALSFVSPDRVRFRWKLEGVDNEWREVGARREVQYNFLRPGDYTFRVIACNNDGVWNEEGAALALRVQPFFHETWWFFTLAGILATVGVAAGVRHFAVRRMRRELEMLEQQRAVERDRARIAKDIHDDLGAGLTHITLLTELARRSPTEETPGHLNHISDMARELTRAMDETVWAVNPRNDSLEGLMTYVTKFAQDYLNVAGIRCRLDLPAQLPPLALTAETRHNLYLAVKETLNNVVKHAHASEVWLRFVPQTDGFTIIIEDNGCGLHGEHSRPDANRISSGHGLGNLEKRLAACAGRCVLTSEPGKGTRVELSVNLVTTT